MRIGLIETKNFCQEFFTDVLPETFLEESAGVADLITSCLGGRNRKTAEAFVTTGKSFDELEREMLGGQSECRRPHSGEASFLWGRTSPRSHDNS